MNVASVFKDRKVGLISFTAYISLLITLIGGAAILVMVRQQLAIENDAQRIYDVVMPKVFESTRMVRSLERLARGGRAILSISEAGERMAMRLRLDSIAMDGSLQGDLTMRNQVEGAFRIIDLNLADMSLPGAASRAIMLSRWEPAEQMLFDTAEAIGAAAATSAAEETDHIITSARAARSDLTLAAGMLISASALGFLIIYFAFSRPVVRLARSLRLAREGYLLGEGVEVIRELQILHDAAVELARAHRELEAARTELGRLQPDDNPSR
jgi:hypothetical protein